MKNLMKRVLGVLIISAAIVANVGAVSPDQVIGKVNEVISKLSASNVSGAFYGQQTNRNSDMAVLKNYAKEYPQIKSQIATINKALTSGSGKTRMQSAQPGGSAFNAAQDIKDILGGKVAPVKKAEQKKEEKQVTQDLKDATKELTQANADLKKVEKQNETAKTTEAQARAQKAMDDAAARVAQKTQELRDMEAALSQNKQQVLVVMEREKALNARVEDLKKQLMNKDLEINKKNELQDALTANTKELEDVKKDLKEKSEGMSSAEKKALDDAARATRNARLAIGATGAGAGLFGYAAGTGAIRRGAEAAYAAVSPYATRAYNAAAPYATRAATAVSPYMTKRAAAAVAGVGAVGAAGAMAYKYYKTATPKDVAAAANTLEKKTEEFKTAKVQDVVHPSEKTEGKIDDIKIELERNSAKTVKALEEMRTWKGDFRGYSQQQIDVAVNALFRLYATEKDLTAKLKEVTEEGIIRNSPKKDREADHKALAAELKTVRKQIKDQEAIAGITRSKAIRKGIYALGAAALLGIAVAADAYFGTGLMTKAYNAMPDVRGRMGNMYNAMPDVRARVSGAATAAYNAMPNVRERAAAAAASMRAGASAMYNRMPSMGTTGTALGTAASAVQLKNAINAPVSQEFYEAQAGRVNAGAYEANVGAGNYTLSTDEQ